MFGPSILCYARSEGSGKTASMVSRLKCFFYYLLSTINVPDFNNNSYKLQNKTEIMHEVLSNMFIFNMVFNLIQVQ